MRVTLFVSIFLQITLLCVPNSVTGQQVQTSPRPSTQQSRPIPEQIADMRKEIDALKARISALETEKNKLLNRVFQVEMAQNANQSALLDLTSHAYQRIDSSTGTFLVSFEDATPYLDGYRVTLSIGNPSFATFKGFKLKVKWNAKYDWDKFTVDSYEKWGKATQERESSFVEELKPGAWNNVTLLLPSTSNNQLGYFLVSMETSTISLHTEGR